MPRSGSGKNGPFVANAIRGDDSKDDESESESSLDDPPTEGFISTVMPMACGITRMSEKMMAASMSKRSTGWMVTSVERKGE